MNSGFGRAVGVEADKLRRAPVVLICTLVIVLAPTLLAVGATLALRSDARGDFAAKAKVMVHGTGWVAFLGTGTQVMSVGVLLALGFAYAWCFGREFVEGTVASLFALPLGRGEIAAAKLAVLLLWTLATSVVATLLLVLSGLAVGSMGSGPIRFWVPIWVCLLTGCNALPLAWVATVLRGYLGAIGVLLALVVATQLFMAVGGGAWFPWAVPGLISGFSVDMSVNAVQQLLPVAVGIVSTILTIHAWRRLQLSAR